MAGVDLLHVPYKGNAPSIADAVSGQIDLVFASVPGRLPFIRSDRIRATAIGSKRRFAAVPAIPTSDEAGVAGKLEKAGEPADKHAQMRWARPHERVFEIDIEQCSACVRATRSKCAGQRRSGSLEGSNSCREQ